jgi:hypothetical protein
MDAPLLGGMATVDALFTESVSPMPALLGHGSAVPQALAAHRMLRSHPLPLGVHAVLRSYPLSALGMHGAAVRLTVGAGVAARPALHSHRRGMAAAGKPTARVTSAATALMHVLAAGAAHAAGPLCGRQRRAADQHRRRSRRKQAIHPPPHKYLPLPKFDLVTPQLASACKVLR